MHECPDCGQACDCDGEDVWNDDLQTYLSCTHDCEEYDDDDIDEYIPPDERLQDLSLIATPAEQRNEAVDAGQKSPSCTPTQHSWKESYYGYKCERCQEFIPYGCEPWMPLDE